jgi:putative PIG3 family NAD(P)H quinone oxidoreductase
MARAASERTTSVDMPTMKAIAIAGTGGPEVLQRVRRAIPQPRADEVLIAVTAAGINNSDLMQRRGELPAGVARPDVPGLEVSGHVARCGADVEDFSTGDPVCALTPGGGYAEFCTAPAGQVLRIPHGVAVRDAAALPEALFTVWSNLFDVARLQSGDVVLVHGGASGMGTMAIQLARAFGARVFATAGGADRCAACEALGAERAIDYRTTDFVAETMKLTDARGADVILDMVGGDYVMRNIACLARNGRIANIAYSAGASVRVDFMELMRRNGSLSASQLRPRPPAEKAAIAARIRQSVWPLLERGLVKPVVSSAFPLDDAASAHRAFEQGRHVGKILLDATPAAA